MRRVATVLSGLVLMGAIQAPSANAMASAEAQYQRLVDRFVDDMYRHHPTDATSLGIHRYDDRFEDFSAVAVRDEIKALKGFQSQFHAIRPAALSPISAADREMVLAAIDSTLLNNETLRLWEKNPDRYMDGVTNSAFSLFKRDFAPVDQRLRALIARERRMPQAFVDARHNLKHPPRIYTDIAISQVDGNIDFFVTTVPQAFAGAKDAKLKAEFAKTNKGVIEALKAYKTFLKRDLLPHADGSYALGVEAYRRKLKADEMIDMPLEKLVAIGEQDLKRNQETFKKAAAGIDPVKSALDVFLALARVHPAPKELLTTTQGMLDEIRQFIIDKRILTIPPSPPAKVAETPPFMRATSSASMDTPGPFEPKAAEAFYNMTLPDPTWPAAEQEEYMQQWYPAMIANVSVHEAYPGHYIQFLYAKQFPSKLRKILGANSNIEGWAHYCEEMMLAEGFRANDANLKLAQAQDALLRDARLIVGIKMHTGQMTYDEAVSFFHKEAYQPLPVAKAEARRGTMDPTYGYYTLGKLMIQKLRQDYQAKQGTAFTLAGFHDAFIKEGPLPLPLIRKAMLGQVGEVL